MESPLVPTRTALVNVHWQQDIVTETGALAPFFHASVAKRGVLDKARRLVGWARDAGILVVWARVAFRPGYPEILPNCALNRLVLDLGALLDGSPGARIVDELTPLPDEPVVTHHGISAFGRTAIDGILRARGVDTVLVSGVATNISVEGTARDAMNLGYRAVLVEDACAAATDEAHDATLATFALLGEVTTLDELASAAVAR